MSFFVEKIEKGVDLVATDMAADPQYADRYAAIKELRGLDDGTLYKGSEWRRVASLQGPLLDLAQVLDPEFLQNKKRFYAFLDAHRESCTYDRRKQSLPQMLMLQDGKVVM